MRYIIPILLTVVLITGCRKYNNGPLENYTEEYVFDPLDKNGITAKQVLSNIYADMPTGFNRINSDLLDAATDDALPSRNGTSIGNISFSNVNNSFHPDNAWTKSYAGIRKVNLFLSKVDVVPIPDEVKIWKAEVRFLRAFFYFELLKRYGGVPLIGDIVFNNDNGITPPRNTFEECVNYIVSELDAIKTIVKKEAIPDPDFGRASRGAVLALKSRVLLYAASPLFNGGVPAGASAAQKALMGYPAYDVERWNKAAQAANEFLSLSIYPLEATYNNVFLNRKNNEVILSYLRGTTTDLENLNGPIGFGQGANGVGLTSPTQELVDAFLMTNGKRIHETGSGYNPANPYTNRDPRLGNTVLRNGSQWLNRTVQTFEGGLDKPNNGIIQTITSYYMRKFLGNFATAATYSAQNHNFVIFRSAEVMLNYAEALNEYSSTPNDLIKNQVINLRKRAGIAAGSDGKYGIPTSPAPDKDQMREIIRNERRIEMAYEEQRYWDARRWKIAEQVFNRDLTGLKITDAGGGNFNYEPVIAGKIIFTPNMYSYPIPYSELSKNPNLIQNFGW